LLLAAAVAAISCTVSPGGLGETPDQERAEAGPSVSPDPTGFAGRPDDGGMRPAAPPLAADAAAPATPTSMPPPRDAARPPPSDTAPAPPPPAPAPPPPAPAPPPPPSWPRVLRVHDVKVGRLTARVVHAHQLDAASGSAGIVLPPDPDRILKRERGTQDIEAAELTVDVLFAHDIKAGWVHIEQTHARVRIKGRQGGD